MTHRRSPRGLLRRPARRRPRRIRRPGGASSSTRALRARLILLVVAFAVGLLSLGARCAHLQIFKARSLMDRALSQQERTVTLDPYRGPILDRNGRELALSLAVDSVYADPSAIDDPAGVAERLSPVVGIKSSKLRKRLLNQERQFVWIKRKITPEQREKIETLDIKGIAFVRESRRYYPKGTLASHVLGACGVDNQGLAGLEFAFDRAIRGTPGRMQFLRDGRGGKVLDRERTEPIPGIGLVLTIDSNIQHIAERELAAAMKSTSAKGGAVVVLRPQTGEVLAMASRPTFDPNKFGAASAKARRNRAVSDFYEPGSAFKTITAAAALDTGRVHPNETIWCENGSIVVARHRFREDSRPFGNLTFTEVLARSSNVGAIKVAQRLEPVEFYDAIRRFGFGEETGIELPGETCGMLRQPEGWSGLSQASLAIGQEVAVTTLQLTAAIGAIANDGVLVPPRLVRATIGPTGRRLPSKSMETAKPQRAITVAAARSLRQMMASITARKATGRRAAVPGYSVGGKTGTAQKFDEKTKTYSRTRHVAWFVGFTPVDNPAIAIVVMVDEPKGPRFHGGDVAAPVFSNIARPVLQYLNVAPDRDATLIFDRSATAALQAQRKTRRAARPSPSASLRMREASLASGAGPAGPGLLRAGAANPGMMPDVTGLSMRWATETLASRGLSCRSNDQRGQVKKQKPAAGTSIGPGDPCSIIY
ncbi:MAG: penicillin-binding transpeptidase domain-containing protein [Acidobacteriota bacterium]